VTKAVPFSTKNNNTLKHQSMKASFLQTSRNPVRKSLVSGGYKPSNFSKKSEKPQSIDSQYSKYSKAGGHLNKSSSQVGLMPNETSTLIAPTSLNTSSLLLKQQTLFLTNDQQQATTGRKNAATPKRDFV
jgi:hypothetical protein